MSQKEVNMRKITYGEKVNCDYRRTCYGIVKTDDKYLITYNELKNEYSLGGGGVEPCETLEDCIRREFLEELGYKIVDIKEFINIDCFWTKRDGNKMETDANFLLVKVSQTDIIEPTESGHKPLWVDKQFLLSHITFPYQVKALEIFMNELDKIDIKFD